MRNIGIMAHIDAGKTTTTERILYYAGKIHKIGEIDDGAATMDWMQQEQERGITIQSAATTIYWKDEQINIIDTPGHVDFTAEVERSLRVLDGALAVICAVGWVQPQTETVWHQADRYKVPRIVFVNKMDRTGADFFAAVEDVKKKFLASGAPQSQARALILQLPIGEGANFQGVIDLLQMKEIRFAQKGSAESDDMTLCGISEENKKIAEEYREKLLDEVASGSDEIAELFLSGKDVPQDLIVAEIRRGTIARDYIPFLCGASRKNIGAQPLLDAIVNFLPSPNDVENPVPEKSRNAPSALVFKIQHDKESGSLCYVRMYSGKIKVGESVYNPLKKKRERVNRILRMHANKSEALESLSAGDIGVFIGLKNSQTGDTLCSEGMPLVLETMHFPEPVISVAVESETLSERDKLKEVLEILTKEDPTFTSREDAETGQMIISGMGELHIDVLVRRMLDDFKVSARVGSPQVTYRESILESAEITEKFERVIGGKENTAQITLKLEADSLGDQSSCTYICNIRNEKKYSFVPAEIFDAIETGIKNSFGSGIKYGYPCCGIKATLCDISYNEQTSTPFAFTSCAVNAFDKAAEKALCAILEPVMSVDITCPNDCVGEAMSKITQRGGIIVSSESKVSGDVIFAEAPMSKMFGFSTDLRSATKGRAAFSMVFKRFQVKSGGL